jgi:hypothetical protein
MNDWHFSWHRRRQERESKGCKGTGEGLREEVAAEFWFAHAIGAFTIKRAKILD